MPLAARKRSEEAPGALIVIVASTPRPGETSAYTVVELLYEAGLPKHSTRGIARSGAGCLALHLARDRLRCTSGRSALGQVRFQPRGAPAGW